MGRELNLKREFLKLALWSLVIVVGVAFVRMFAESRLDTASQIHTHAADWRAGTHQWMRGLGEVILTEGTPSSIDLMVSGRREADRHIRAMRSHWVGDERFRAWLDEWNRLVTRSRSFDAANDRSLRTTARKIEYGALMADLDDFTRRLDAAVVKLGDEHAAAAGSLKRVSRVITLLVLAWMAFAFFRVGRLVTGPLSELTRLFGSVSKEQRDWRTQIAEVRDRLVAWREKRANEVRLHEISVLIDAGVQMLGRLSHQATRAERYARIVRMRSERFAHQASHDALTGLHNRRYFMDSLSGIVRRSEGTGEPFALFFIDLDHFKNVNDTLGHDAGDDVLIEVSRRLGQCFRQRDLVCRLGGDEFAAVVPAYAESRQLSQIAERVRGLLAEPFDVRGSRAHLGCSIGIALYPQHAADAIELTQMADLAMYEAKAAGRNAVRFYTRDAKAHLNERTVMADRLRRALEKGEGFRLVYQAQYALLPDGARAEAVEALLRWEDAELGNVPPGVFVALAEEASLIVPLGRWVLEAACRQLAAWRQMKLPCDRVSVNVSAVELAAPEFAADVLAIIAQHGLSSGSIELEITERLITGRDSTTVSNLETLRKAGVRFAIDDFGTGYSALGYLRRVPFDVLKIDRSLVDGIADEPTHRVIVDAIVAMARAFGASVVAEGVERGEDLSYLRAAGVGLAQGYLLARPLEAGAVPGFFERATCAADLAAPLALLPSARAAGS